MPEDLLDNCAKYTFALFPPLDAGDDEQVLEVLDHLFDATGGTSEDTEPPAAHGLREIRLIPNPRRAATRDVINMRDKNKTLSKILNTQGIELSDLRFGVDESYAYDKQFRRVSA